MVGKQNHSVSPKAAELVGPIKVWDPKTFSIYARLKKARNSESVCFPTSGLFINVTGHFLKHCVRSV